MPTLTTIIQHSFGSASHNNQRRKRSIRNIGWKRIKTLFADNIILYIENTKDAIRNLLQLIDEFSKVAGCKTMKYQKEEFKKIPIHCCNKE